MLRKAKKNSRKFVYILAKQCRSHFNLTNIFDKKYQNSHTTKCKANRGQILAHFYLKVIKVETHLWGLLMVIAVILKSKNTCH